MIDSCSTRALVSASLLVAAAIFTACEKPEERSAQPATKAAAPKAETPAPPVTETPPTQAPAPQAAKPTEPAKPTDNTNVQTLPSGIILEDLVLGKGDSCPPNATVTIHYRGTLKDGTEFDSSIGRGQPATFALADLIQGWQEGIPGMKPGGKRKLTIPYRLAYGERGRPPVIPAKADLIFEIELFSFKK